jgi:hypothetical protein
MNETEIEYLKENLKFWAIVLTAIATPWFIVYVIL